MYNFAWHGTMDFCTQLFSLFSVHHLSAFWCLLVMTPWFSSFLMSKVLWFYSPFSIYCLSLLFGSLKEVTSRGCIFVLFFKPCYVFSASLSFFYDSQWSSESWSLSFWYYYCWIITNMHDLWTATHSSKLVSLAFFIAFWDNFILFI